MSKEYETKWQSSVPLHSDVVLWLKKHLGMPLKDPHHTLSSFRERFFRNGISSDSSDVVDLTCDWDGQRDAEDAADRTN